MESWDNKIISDKINSLQDLPDGYMPNLSSKWEIIEAGLPVQKKRRLPVIIRWTVAAAVVAGLLLVWMQERQPEKRDYTVNPVQINKVPAQNVQPLPTAMAPALTANNGMPVREDTSQADRGDVAAVLPIREKANQDNRIQKPEILAKENSQSRLLVDTVLQSQDTSAVAINNELASIPLPEKSKPVKRKIYQRDFDDGLLVIDTGYAKSASQHIGIRIFPFSNRMNDEGEQPTRRLQLKQSL